MRLLFLNNHHSNEKIKKSLKKTLVNLISRNTTTNHTVKLTSTKVITVKPRKPVTPSSPPPKTITKDIISSKPIIHEQTHWKESSTPKECFNSQCPTAFTTHEYIRSTRSNPNQLRLIAAANGSRTPVAFCRVIKKRSDEFVWGKQSQLRNEL